MGVTSEAVEAFNRLPHVMLPYAFLRLDHIYRELPDTEEDLLALEKLEEGF
jgi:hypothetical protein